MKDQLEYLKRQAAMRRISRRAFLGRVSALGVSAAMANVMLAESVQAQTPQKGGTIRMGIQGGSASDSLDPATTTNSFGTQVNKLWGEQLVELAPHEGLEVKVAEEWSSSPDAKIWSFKIRPDIQFSNG